MLSVQTFLSAALAFAGLFSLAASSLGPDPDARDPDRLADEAAVDICARLLGLVLLAASALVAWP